MYIGNTSLCFYTIYYGGIGLTSQERYYKTIDKNKLFSGMLRKKIRHGG